MYVSNSLVFFLYWCNIFQIGLGVENFAKQRITMLMDAWTHRLYTYIFTRLEWNIRLFTIYEHLKQLL